MQSIRLSKERDSRAIIGDAKRINKRFLDEYKESVSNANFKTFEAALFLFNCQSSEKERKTSKRGENEYKFLNLLVKQKASGCSIPFGKEHPLFLFLG